jgi:ABC-type branched-subunit amino acid transport system substrate-binding protein
LSDVRKTWGLWPVLLLLACTVGETPPQPPVSEPPIEPTAEEPGPAEPGAGAEVRGAEELLAESRRAYDRAELEESLRLAEQVVAEYPGSTSEAEARWLAAQAAFALGRYQEAGELADEVADRTRGERETEAEALVELAEDALERPSQVAVVGAVLPRSGPRVLVRYADWVLEGMQLAVEEAETRQNRRIDLVVVDDEGGLRVREAVRELERQGAVAIVGPLLPEHIASAAGARSDGGLVMVSPTSTERPRWPEAFSINSYDARGARELGQYAADLGFTQAAILYSRSADFEGKAEAFAREFRELGGVVRTMVPYDSGTTTFGPHMERVLAAVGARDISAGQLEGETASSAAGGEAWATSGSRGPFALFVAAPDRDVPQIAPQVAFYGLDAAGAQVFGDEAWASASVRRVVPNRDLEGVIASSRFPPDRASATADPDFIAAYEDRYRRSLANPLPALGYDAANLILQALPNRMLTPGALARRFGLLAGIRGATGLLSVRGERVIRTPYLVVIRGGELEAPPYPWEYELPAPNSAQSGSPGGGP